MAWFAWLYIICDNFFCYEYQIKLSIIIGLFFKFKISSFIWYIYYISYTNWQVPLKYVRNLGTLTKASPSSFTHISPEAHLSGNDWLVIWLIDSIILSLIQSIIHIFMHFNLLFSTFQEASFYVFHYNS